MKVIRYIFVLILLIGSSSLAFSQSDTIKLIEQQIEKINKDSLLDFKEFDAVDIYENNFDGGGFIKIYYKDDTLLKVHQQIGLSYGSIETIIYFSQDYPIFISEIEDNFKLNDDGATIDYTTLVNVFKSKTYVFDWNADSNKTIKDGKRVFSDDTCNIFEHEPLIELARDLLSK
jgi:glucan phosphorylase